MTYAEAIEYLQTIADRSRLKRHSVALNKAIDALREMQRIEEMKPIVLNAKDELYETFGFEDTEG